MVVMVVRGRQRLEGEATGLTDKVSKNIVGPEIAGALARFWAGGEGPSHSSISTAFSLAGYQEPPIKGNKQQRVLRAVRGADSQVARRLVEGLLDLLRTAGHFDRGAANPAVATFQAAAQRGGFELTPEGFIDWEPDASKLDEPAKASRRVGLSPARIAPTVETVVPSVDLLVNSLRRLPSALRPLMLRRRGRPGMSISDEYDLQDFVESLLRSLYNDVRPEERTPSYAGASSVMDFLLRDDALAIEVKVTAPGRSEKQVKGELLVDIHDYQQHPSVRALIGVVYDLASTFSNPDGFESDLTRAHGNLDVRVIVVGWPLPNPSRPEE